MTIAERIRALRGDGPIYLDVAVEIEAIAAECERLAGEVRSIEGCDTWAELTDRLLVWADALAKEGK